MIYISNGIYAEHALKSGLDPIALIYDADRWLAAGLFVLTEGGTHGKTQA
ncbi:hypothetical protein [Metabacillus sp. RGM 3146]